MVKDVVCQPIRLVGNDQVTVAEFRFIYLGQLKNLKCVWALCIVEEVMRQGSILCGT